MNTIGRTSYAVEITTDGVDDIVALNREISQMQEEFTTFNTGLNESEKEIAEWLKQLGFTSEELEELQKVSEETAKLLQFKVTGLDPEQVERFRKELKDTADQANKTKGFMEKLGAAAKLAASYKLASVFSSTGREMLNAAAAHEDLSVSMTVMLGSAEKAKSVLADLNKFANVTPYNPDEVNASGRALLSYGVAADNLESTLLTLGDVAAGTGMSIQDLSDIYGKNLTQGVIQTNDLMQLAGRGIPIFEEMAKVMGTTADKVKGMASSGAIQFEHLEKAFRNMSGEGGKYAGMMGELSKTWNGLEGALGGNIDNIKKGIGGMILTALKPLLQVAVAFTDWITQNETAMMVLKAAFLALGVIVGGLLLSSVVAATTAFWGMATAVIAATWPFVLALAAIAAVGAAIYWLVTHVEEVGAVVGAVGNYIWLVIESIAGFFVWLGKKIPEPFVKAFNATKARFNNFVNFVKAIPGKIVDFFKSIPERIKNAFLGLKNIMMNFLKDILPESIYNVILRVSGGSEPEHRATGGPVTSGKPFLVGEEGPELFVPGTDGRIIPNHKLGSGKTGASGTSGITIHFNTTINASGNGDASEIKRAVEEVIRGAIPAIREKLALEGI